MSTVYKPKTSKQLYRDCLRLIKHMAGTTSQKSITLRQIVAQRFRDNKDVTDPATLHVLKQTAEKGLSNYLLFERAKLDPKIAAASAEMDDFEDDEHGNLVRVAKSGSAKASAAAKARAARAKAAAQAPPTADAKPLS